MHCLGIFICFPLPPKRNTHTIFMLLFYHFATHVGRPNKKVECRNHIRVIQPINFNGHRLYVCGTNAHNPKDYVINVSIEKEIFRAEEEEEEAALNGLSSAALCPRLIEGQNAEIKVN